MEKKIERLVRGAYDELTLNILPFWMEKTRDELHGGFVGRVDGNGNVVPGSPKGAVLNTRILWTFSAAYRILGRPEYLEMAVRAKDYLLEKFIDEEYGGIYWSLDEQGRPLDTKKQSYAIGFAIYGLSEFHRATGDPGALGKAVELFLSLEQNARDGVYGGYMEALDRQWKPMDDVRLSAKDENAVKTMNTHLHIIEPYANLYRVWPDKRLAAGIGELLDIFSGRIYDPATGHFRLFFDREWTPSGEMFSYGHDIEGSWLLHEAVLVSGDGEKLSAVMPVVINLARAASEGLASDGSMVYEHDPATGHTDTDRHWWVQAEAVVGYYNLYALTGSADALDKALSCWDYILRRFSGGPAGEWRWSVDAGGEPIQGGDLAGFWKCPYHNSRMCLELIERTGFKEL